MRRVQKGVLYSFAVLLVAAGMWRLFGLRAREYDNWLLVAPLLLLSALLVAGAGAVAGQRSSGRRSALRPKAVGALRRARRGQALLETAIVLPLLLSLVFGVLAVGRLTRAQMAVSGVAREAARAGALADTPAAARAEGVRRGREVVPGYRLGGAVSISVDPSAFRPGGRVVANASYRVRFDDLPLLGWVGATVRSTQVETVELHRSRRGEVERP